MTEAGRMAVCYKLILAYDGSCYSGWQSCNQGGSVEEALTTALNRLFGQPVPVEGASRTDAGVHARGQVAVVKAADARYTIERLMVSLNSLLAPSLRVCSIERSDPAFHPTIDAIAKEYRYTIDNAQAADPLTRSMSWHLHQPLDLNLMRQAAACLTGTHDFSCFCNQRKDMRYKDKERTIYAIEITEAPRRQIVFSIAGNSFLYKMARNMIGFLVSIGLKGESIELLDHLFERKDRRLAPMTAPAKGLVLEQIFYNKRELDSFLKRAHSQ